MPNEKEFETDAISDSSSSSPDYLQEKSEFVANLQQKLKQNENSANFLDENVPYSERSKAAGKAHIRNLEEALAGMRQREDYGVPNKDAHGQDLEGDISFLERPAKIPEDLKEE